jgi:hypothetical protein
LSEEISGMEIKSSFNNTRMLKKTGSWIYCNSCGKTVAYLCYSTYQKFAFQFCCQCGAAGGITVEKPDAVPDTKAVKSLYKNKSRLCCPDDDAPLFSIVEKHIKSVSYQVTCNNCLHSYEIEKMEI